jgi:carboxypeptidase Taq
MADIPIADTSRVASPLELMTDPTWDKLMAVYQRAATLDSCLCLLKCDQTTVMPEAGSDHRSQQIALLAELQHECLTDPRIPEWLETLSQISLTQDPEMAATLRVVRQEYQRAIQVPADLVGAIEQAAVIGEAAWKAARKARDFTIVSPHIGTMLDLKRQEADARRDGQPHPISRYDALLDLYEPGLTTDQYLAVGDVIKTALAPLCHALPVADHDIAPCLHGRQFSLDGMQKVARRLSCAIGLDPAWSRVDTGETAVSGPAGPKDIRVSIRHGAGLVGFVAFILHEGGHGKCHYGIAIPRPFGHPLNETSIGIHETQARFWESVVGKLPEFWEAYYPILQACFPLALAGVSAADFTGAMQYAVQSPTRARGDDLATTLSPLLRSNLEIRLLAGDLKPSEIPAAWKEESLAYLGTCPDDILRGPLTDPHWPKGLYAYYATYVVGSLRAGKQFATIERQHPGVREEIRRGDLSTLDEWQEVNIYRYGRSLPPPELMIRATGASLDPEPWIALMRTRYSRAAA